ncbi:hypothetical protein D3C85_112900 [compost metagenome]
MSTNTAFDLLKLYKTYFNNTPYFVSNDDNKPLTQEPGYSITMENPRPKGSIDYSSKNIAFNKIGSYGQDIWFPIELWKSGRKLIEIEACTVGVNLMKEIIRTPVSERKGKVKECFAIDDYRFSIKGFLIGKNRLVPEDQIQQLKDWFETTEPIELHGGYPEIFLDESCRVAVSNLDFPEVQGKAPWIRPFTMTIETDYIQDLIIP